MRRGGSILFLFTAVSVLTVPLAAAGIPDLGTLPPHLETGSARAEPAPGLLEAPRVPALADARTRVDVTVDPVPAPVTPGAPAVTRALVQYCYESAGAFATPDATTVRVKAHLEHWYDAVGARVDPSEFTVDPVPPESPAEWSCAPARAVNVTVEPWYPFRDEVAIIVTATADANAPFTASEGTDVLRVEYARSSGEGAPADGALAPAHVQDVVEGATAGFGVVPVAAFGLLILAAAGGVFVTRRE